MRSAPLILRKLEARSIMPKSIISVNASAHPGDWCVGKHVLAITVLWERMAAGCVATAGGFHFGCRAALRHRAALSTPATSGASA